MKNVAALINLHSSPELGLLTEKRPMASTTFLGRYAFIDFTISNLTNSGIDDIGIMIKDHSRSIIKHIRNDNTYLKNTKTGFINYMINETGIHNPLYNTDLNNIRENDYLLYDNDIKYVIICPLGILMKANYAEILEEHIKSGKPFSCVYSEVKHAGRDFFGLNKLTVNALGNIQKVEPIDPKDEKVYAGLRTYICNKDALKDILEKIKNISNVFTLEDLIIYVQRFGGLEFHGIEFKGMVKYLNSLKKYYEISMELKDIISENKCPFLSDDWTIYTCTHDTRPVLYGLNCEVSDSLVANGCTINGKVKGSILARNIVVEEGASVEDSIIFSDCVIKKGVHLKNVVADKLCIFANKTEIHGDKNEIIYVPQGEKL